MFSNLLNTVTGVESALKRRLVVGLLTAILLWAHTAVFFGVPKLVSDNLTVPDDGYQILVFVLVVYLYGIIVDFIATAVVAPLRSTLRRNAKQMKRQNKHLMRLNEALRFWKDTLRGKGDLDKLQDGEADTRFNISPDAEIGLKQLPREIREGILTVGGKYHDSFFYYIFIRISDEYRSLVSEKIAEAKELLSISTAVLLIFWWSFFSYLYMAFTGGADVELFIFMIYMAFLALLQLLILSNYWSSIESALSLLLECYAVDVKKRCSRRLDVSLARNQTRLLRRQR